MMGGRMNFLRDGIKVPHTIINIPSDGVYLYSESSHFFKNNKEINKIKK
jgi:hypothetical protein